MEDETYSLAVKTALKMLGRKAYSEQEMRLRLKGKDYELEIIDAVIDYFKGYGYIDDAKLCEDLFNNLSQSGRYGIYVIIAKLRERKIPKELIKRVAAEYDFDLELEKALKIIRKRYSVEENNEKIGRHLSSKGFSPAVVRKAIETLRN